MPVLELGPVSTRIVRVMGSSLARLGPQAPAVVLTVEDGATPPQLGTSEVANLPAAPLSPAELADAAELRLLRAALYGDPAS